MSGVSRAAPEPAEAEKWRELDVLHMRDGQLAGMEIASLLSYGVYLRRRFRR